MLFLCIVENAGDEAGLTAHVYVDLVQIYTHLPYTVNPDNTLSTDSTLNADNVLTLNIVCVSPQSTIKSLKESKRPIHLLTELNVHLKSVLSQWFSPQLMELTQVTWESPCDILEKVSLYEAVHPLRHWKDLKHRVGQNRRCFIFTHKAIPREPIVVLHAALTSGPSNRIQVSYNIILVAQLVILSSFVLDSVRSKSSRKIRGYQHGCVLLHHFHSKRSAWHSSISHLPILHSVSGLSGVELGNYLIRMVAKELQKEFPQQLSNLVTLSPIPGFRRWLDSHIKLHSQEGIYYSKTKLDYLPHQRGPAIQ